MYTGVLCSVINSVDVVLVVFRSGCVQVIFRTCVEKSKHKISTIEAESVPETIVLVGGVIVRLVHDYHTEDVVVNVADVEHDVGHPHVVGDQPVVVVVVQSVVEGHVAVHGHSEWHHEQVVELVHAVFVVSIIPVAFDVRRQLNHVRNVRFAKLDVGVGLEDVDHALKDSNH